MTLSTITIKRRQGNTVKTIGGVFTENNFTDEMKNNLTNLGTYVENYFIEHPPVGGGAVGNIDGGSPDSEFGGVEIIDGGTS